MTYGLEQDEFPAFDLSVKRGQCLLLSANPEQIRVLQKIFLRELKPTSGWIEELQFVSTISNTQIYQRLDFENTMKDHLQSLLFQSKVWFGGRLCSQRLLMEHLQLTPVIQKQKLKMLSRENLHDFLVLALALAKVDLVLLDSTLAPHLACPAINFLQKCFPSPFKTLVVFAPTSLDNAMFDEVLKF